LTQLLAVDEMPATVAGLATGAPVDGAHIGTIVFATWFATHPQGARQ
jgi:hypothetical protein